MSKYYIIWSNYDGNNIDEYQQKADAEKACALILSKQDAHERGTNLDCVIEGRKINPKTIQVTAKVKF